MRLAAVGFDSIASFEDTHADDSSRQQQHSSQCAGAVLDTWQTLPESLRAGILAMIKSKKRPER